MDKKGEIDYLSKIIKPDISVITNINYAHAKNFKKDENLSKITKRANEFRNWQDPCIDSVCINKPGSYECQCLPGFEMLKNTKNNNTCVNINECEQSLNLYPDQELCGKNSYCVDTKGSYTCQCALGFTKKKDGNEECQDIDECNDALSNPCKNMNENHPTLKFMCKNTIGSFQCVESRKILGENQEKIEKPKIDEVSCPIHLKKLDN